MSSKYYVVKAKALPEVFLKVAEAKELLATGKVKSISEAVEKVDISRSSFYKYKDDILPFADRQQGKTVTLSIQLEDIPGVLAATLQTVADYHANILTIHQSVPVSGIALMSISLEILPQTGNLSELVDELDRVSGIKAVKIVARE